MDLNRPGRVRRDLCSVALYLIVAFGSTAAEERGIAISILDKASGQPMPARVHLKDASGTPYQPKQFPFWRDHFVCPGEARLELAAGIYTIEVERGPEFSSYRGDFVVADGMATNVTVALDRIVDLSAEGWWSGELHVHRPVADAELLMRAEDLHVAPFITWWNRQNHWSNAPPENPLRQFDGNRFVHLLGGEDEREGGALLYFNLKQPLPITGATRHFPSSLVYAGEARKLSNVWIDIEKPFWWDFPLWIASGWCDSVGIANNHMHRSGMYNGEAWGRARDTNAFPTLRGNGFWTQEIYYHALNCGVRIAPSAGSASGVLPNPVGYNRVYVQVGPELTYEKWWDGLRAGRSFVSNGPLLRGRANGKWPGEVFRNTSGKAFEVELDATLDGRDAVPAVEIIRDGKVVRSVPVTNGSRATLGRLTFNESGWFLLRAISGDTNTFRFASTAPFYVEVGTKPHRISKASAQFFLDWVKEGMTRIQLPAGERRDAVLEFHRAAEKFWKEKVASANAE